MVLRTAYLFVSVSATALSVGRSLSRLPWIGQILPIGFPVSYLNVLKKSFHISLGQIFLKCVFSHVTALNKNFHSLPTDLSLKLELLYQWSHRPLWLHPLPHFPPTSCNYNQKPLGFPFSLP